MKKRNIILVAAIGLLLATVVLMWPESEPICHGKKLSEWVGDLDHVTWQINTQPQGQTQHKALTQENTVEADFAITEIGTNALPFLRKIILSHEPALKTAFIRFLKKQSFIKQKIPDESFRHSRAIQVCAILDKIAQPLVLPLAENFSRLDPVSQMYARGWLMNLGPEAEAAIPFLLENMSGTNNPTSYETAHVIARISTRHPDLAIPGLKQIKKSTDPLLRTAAQSALWELGAE